MSGQANGDDLARAIVGKFMDLGQGYVHRRAIVRRRHTDLPTDEGETVRLDAAGTVLCAVRADGGVGIAVCPVEALPLPYDTLSAIESAADDGGIVWLIARTADLADGAAATVRLLCDPPGGSA